MIRLRDKFTLARDVMPLAGTRVRFELTDDTVTVRYWESNTSERVVTFISSGRLALASDEPEPWNGQIAEGANDGVD